MLIMNQNHNGLFDTTNCTIDIVYNGRTKKYVLLGFNNGRGSAEISAYDTEEEATSALAYIYAMAVAKQTAISMPKGTLDLEKEAASTIIANSIAETCIMGGNKNANNEPEL